MNNHTKPTQAQRVLDYMQEKGSITQFEALEILGVMRLASRISELKKKGYPITSKPVVVKNRYGEKCRVKSYSLDYIEVGKRYQQGFAKHGNLKDLKRKVKLND